MKTLITFCISFIMLNCSSIRKNKITTEDHTHIEAILPPNTYKTVQEPLDIDFYIMQQKLIEGTTNEYTNKAVFIRKLSEKEVSKFAAIINIDTSYDWNSYSEKATSFTPNKQFRIKANNGQVNILLDENQELISFINLDGQNIIPITNKLKRFLEKFQ